jgi:S-DNA-T family DNA segregation ATPase FtsK/SpoIIIE
MADFSLPEIALNRTGSQERAASREESDEPTAVVRRARKPAGSKQSKDTKKKPVQTPDPDERIRHVTAILLILFSVLLLLALVSYTPLDQANADVGARDVVGSMISNNPAISAMADTTENWLGLLGAFIANFLINSTIGYATLAFPVLLGFWGWTIFSGTEYGRATRISLYSLLVLTLVASMFGTMQLVSWMHHPAHEWSGSVGAYLSAMLTTILGAAGSFLILLAATFIAIVYFFDLDVQAIVQTIWVWMRTTWEHVNASTAEINRRLGERSAIQSERREASREIQRTIDSIDEPPQDNEPARMVRRMQATDNEPEMEARRPAMKGVAAPHPTSSPNSTVDRRADTRTESTHTSAQPLYAAAPPPSPAVVSQVLRPDRNIPFPGDALQPTGTDLANSLESQALHSQPLPQPQAAPVQVVHNAQVMPVEPPRPQRLTVNVQDIELDADMESEDGGELIDKLVDEEIKYIPPSIDLLVPQSEQADVLDEELEENARILQQKLVTFNIQIEDLTVTPGPVVTLYEFVPAAGIKISQIESLADDIALALKARGIRIIAPIPGKGTVGVEIPNHKPAMVRIRSVINTQKFREADLRLPLALGKTTIGEVYCDDLTKMPHLLIAGATGSGKSVGINSILTSLLYKMHPGDLKFVVIDPKKIELTQYRALKDHFLARCPDIDEDIVTQPQNAVIALKSLELEMDRRYDVLARAKQRNIFDYNKKVEDGAYLNDKEYHHIKLPYIVLILDELADLMITASKEIEEPIARLAQLARAIGIHMIVATQRPSVDVITGMIKANFPARIAYQVATKIDSRTILDMNGAEQLLGNGDMLFLPGGMPKPIRLQNAFVSTDEVEAICEHIGRQHGYTRPYELPSVVEKNKKSGGGSVSSERDELFDEAARLIVRHQQGSVSLLQRRLKVGYSRAARIVDELEMAGIVGPFDGSKARAVLLESEAELEAYL